MWYSSNSGIAGRRSATVPNMAILLFPRLPTPPLAQSVPPGSLALCSLDNAAILMKFILILKGGGTSEEDVRIVTPDFMVR